MRKRLLAWVLTLALTLSLLPAVALATGETVTVKVAAQMDGDFLYPQTELTVQAGIAETYGFTNDAGVPAGTATALDALVAAHVDKYGASFTTETASTYLTMAGTNPSMFFGADGTDRYSGFSINYQYPQSGSLGYVTNNAPLNEGDTLDFFYYSDSYADYTAWFTTARGRQINTLTVGQDTPVTIGLKGYMYMGGYASPEPENLYDPDGGLSVYLLNADGTLDKSLGDVTSETGIELNFQDWELGTYRITAMGVESKKGAPLILPVLTLQVQTTDPGDQEKPLPTGVTVEPSQVNLPLDRTYQMVARVEPAAAAQGLTYEVLMGEATVSATGLITPTAKAKAKDRAIVSAICAEDNTKRGNLTVIFQTPPTSEEVLTALVAQLPATWTPMEWNEASTAKLDTNLIAMVQAAVTKLNPAVTVNAVCVPGEGQTQIAADGAITYGEAKVSKKPVTFTLELGGVSQAYTATATVAAKAATKEEAFAATWLNFDAIKGGNTAENNILQDLSLPKEDDEGYYTELEWTSSNPAVLSVSSYATNGKFTGKVTRPVMGQEDAQITLTAKIKPGSYWDYGMAPAGPMPSPAYGTKTFTLTVPAVTADELTAAQALVNEGIKLYSLDGVTARDTKTAANLMALTYHINDIPYNWNYVNKLPGFQEAYRVIPVTWSSTNPGITEVSSGATITRTGVDQTGDIVLTLTYNGATATKRFPTKVLAFTAENAAAENAILQQVKDALTFEQFRKDNWNISQVEGSLLRLQAAVKGSDGFTFSTSTQYHHTGANIKWASSNTAVISNTLAVTRPNTATTVTLTATLTSPKFAGCAGVETLTKTFQVTVLEKGQTNPAASINTALAAIAAKHTATLTDWWWAVGMQGYAAYMPETAHKPTPQAKQALADSLIADLVKNPTSSNSLANAINGLSALGLDPTNITDKDGVKHNAVALLKSVDVENEKKNAWSYFTVPGYVLLACNQGDYDTQTLESAIIEFLLANTETNGGWSTAWGVDATAMTLQGLAPYYHSNSQVKAAADKAVAVLATKQKDNGCMANVSSDAMVVLALTALGIDVNTDSRFQKNGKSMAEHLLTHYSNGGFGLAFYDSQGFLSSLAAAQQLSGKTTWNAFDFSTVAKLPAVATPNGTGGGEVPPTPPVGETMNISFTLKTHNATWLGKHTLAVPKDASVGDAFRQALDGKTGYSYDANGGYVKSITYNGTTLAEFSQGPNSGWKYMVNGVAPSVGMDSKTLSAGDNLVWYYVTDYTTDTDRDEGSFTKPVTGPEVTGKGEDAVVSVAPAATADKNGQATAQVTEKELTAALAAAQKGEAGTLVLAPQVKGTASAVTVELPTASAAAIAKAGLPIRVETGLATLTLNVQALTALGAGKDGTLSITAKTGEDGAVTLSIQAGKQTVETVAGGVKVALPAGKAGPGTVLMQVDKDGNQTPIKLSVLSDGTLTALLNGSATVKLVDNAKEFSDLNDSHWAANAVAFASGRELLVGTETGSYEPEAPVNRASVMTILHRLDGTKIDAPQAGESWYAPAQSWAVERGLTDGTNPEEAMTRQELAVMLYHYVGGTAGEGKPQSGDAADIASWAVEAMSWATRQGILTGDQNGMLQPKAILTRAETATVLERLVGLLVR